MKARDIMTRTVITVPPETPAGQIAKLLLDHRISAVPVVDGKGAPIGIVSESDLVGRGDMDREARRSWWLSLVTQPAGPRPEHFSGLRAQGRKARDIMSGPVITIGEDTDITEAARLLATYRIKRMPVLREGRIVGVLSRVDLLRALAAVEPPLPSAAAATRDTFLSRAFAAIDRGFEHYRHPPPPLPPTPPPAARAQGDVRLNVTDFRRLVADYDDKELQERDEARRLAAERRRQEVEALIDQHMSDDSWRMLLQQARQAAERGQQEFLLLRFPSQLCSDAGRAINASEPGWATTLRGEAAEIYLRWERDLKPHGFHLAARVLDFPGGMPGDIGLFLLWAG